MNGSAPKSSAIGSHTFVMKKFRPNLWRGKAEPVHSSKTSSSVISTTVAANKKVTSRAISSPLRSLARNEREPSRGLAFGTLIDGLATFVRVRLSARQQKPRDNGY